MKPTKTWVALATLAGLLTLAPAVPAQTNAPGNNHTNATPPAGRRPGGMMSVDARLSQWSTQLKLTEEQKPKVKAVLEGQDKQMQGIRDLAPEDRRAKMRSIREETTTKMKGILTADQFKQFEEMQGRGGRRPHGGNPPGGNPPGEQ